MPSGRRTFELVPRRRLTGLPFGDLASRRRGHGSDVIAHRPYEPGDPVGSIDWFASARLSATSGMDAFVVRQRAADEAPRVVLVVDRRPSMGLYPEPLPWLAKPAALAQAIAAITASATAARADLAALDHADGEPWWLPPGRRDRAGLIAEREAGGVPFAAPADSLERAIAFLRRRRSDVPSGSFVFVLSDFIPAPPGELWQNGIACGWDLVPVVIQDPVWEGSFPEVGGVGVPVADAGGAPVGTTRLSRRSARARRAEHERRHAALLAQFAAFGIRPVAIASSDPDDIDTAFAAWAEERRRTRWAR